MNNKDIYRAFCESRNDLPLFMQPFWLDLTCEPGQWDVALSRNEDGSLRGVWAYRHGKKLGIRWIKLPVLSPMTGIWIESYADSPLQKQIAIRQEILTQLEGQLPRAGIVELKLPRTLQDWLPLYWKGYKEETRYTFLFREPDPEKIQEGFSKSFQRNLRAAERHYSIQEGTVKDLYRLMERVFELRDATLMFSQETLGKMVQALQDKKQAKIYAAQDAEGVKAIILIAWDAHTSYYLIGGRHGTDSKNGINLLLWQAIQDAARRGHAFDFEGSMIQGVNKFFQNFGAELTPYHYIYKYRGLAKLKYFLGA